MKSQDILLLLRLLDLDPHERTFPRLATELGISASELHAGLRRGGKAGLVDVSSREVRRENLCEFLVHGVKYVFPAEWVGVTRGVPTSYAAPPLKAQFAAADLPPVWPLPEGETRGEGLKPLHRSAPSAALKSPVLHEWLALIDAVRAGRARERNLAVKEIDRRLVG